MRRKNQRGTMVFDANKLESLNQTNKLINTPVIRDSHKIQEKKQ